ncbi:hypothetical protein [Maribacter sp. 2307ULW6-5]|uniref:hypothetical protein n=1 Tax=Maribacter sp. 2307ULW6-5 TaxID=3386275 RepID=UPI0039BD6A8D
MKNLKKMALLGTTLALLSVSCDKEDVNNIPEVEDTKATVQLGTWRVVLLEDSGEDETADFAGYTFTFAENGQLTATNNSSTQTGSWSVRNDRDSDDRVDDVEFIINFPVPESSIFDVLNDDWDIVSVTDTRIELIDRDEDEADDKLTFGRN